MTLKSKELCAGCTDNFYNGEGAEECWSYKDAKVVERYRIGWWTTPTIPGAFTKVTTLQCHREPGRYAYKETLPYFAVDPK